MPDTAMATTPVCTDLYFILFNNLTLFFNVHHQTGTNIKPFKTQIYKNFGISIHFFIINTKKNIETVFFIFFRKI